MSSSKLFDITSTMGEILGEYRGIYAPDNSDPMFANEQMNRLAEYVTEQARRIYADYGLRINGINVEWEDESPRAIRQFALSAVEINCVNDSLVNELNEFIKSTGGKKWRSTAKKQKRHKSKSSSK